MKVSLTSIKRFSEDKEGNPLKTKDGRPYTRLLIRTKEHGERGISGFDNIQTQNWKEGDEVEIEVEPKGEYLNFKLPNKQDLVSKQLEEINNRTLKIILMLEEMASRLIPKDKPKIDGTDIDYPDEDIDPDKIPF